MPDPEMTEEERKRKIAETEALMAKWAAEAEAEKKKKAEAKAAIERKNEGALQAGAGALSGRSRSGDMLKKIEH